VRQGEGGRAHERCLFLCGGCSKDVDCEVCDQGW
jgi:hypothetical protein